MRTCTRTLDPHTDSNSLLLIDRTDRSLPAVVQSLVIHIDGSGNKRQAQDARVKVYGDAYVYGGLEIVVDTDPTPGPPPLLCVCVLFVYMCACSCAV